MRHRGLDLHPDFDTAIAAIVREGQRIEPDSEHQQMYREVYLNIYKKLQPLYSKIRDITGYPQAVGAPC